MTAIAPLIRHYFDEQQAIMERFPVDELARVAELLFATYDAGGTDAGSGVALSSLTNG
jgi:hypothetical protein